MVRGDMSETRFQCFLPAIQSAIKWHGSGDSVRFQLEVPRDELAAFLPMLEWTQGMLEVTVRPVGSDEGRKSTKKHF